MPTPLEFCRSGAGTLGASAELLHTLLWPASHVAVSTSDPGSSPGRGAKNNKRIKHFGLLTQVLFSCLSATHLRVQVSICYFIFK